MFMNLNYNLYILLILSMQKIAHLFFFDIIIIFWTYSNIFIFKNNVSLFFMNSDKNDLFNPTLKK